MVYNFLYGIVKICCCIEVSRSELKSAGGCVVLLPLGSHTVLRSLAPLAYFSPFSTIGVSISEFLNGDF